MVRKKGWAEMDKGRIEFGKLREAYAVFNKTSGKSPHTVEWYEFRLELFERFLGRDAKLGDLTIPRVREYVAELQERGELYLNNPRVRREGKLSQKQPLFLAEPGGRHFWRSAAWRVSSS